MVSQTCWIVLQGCLLFHALLSLRSAAAERRNTNTKNISQDSVTTPSYLPPGVETTAYQLRSHSVVKRDDKYDKGPETKPGATPGGGDNVGMTSGSLPGPPGGGGGYNGACAPGFYPVDDPSSGNLNECLCLNVTGRRPGFDIHDYINERVSTKDLEKCFTWNYEKGSTTESGSEMGDAHQLRSHSVVKREDAGNYNQGRRQPDYSQHFLSALQSQK